MSSACFARSLADLGMLLQGPRSPTSKRNSLTCCLISCEAKRVAYHQASIYETWWYTTPLTSQLIRQQVVEFLFDVGFLGPCRSMPRSAMDLAKHAKDLAKHAKDVAKHAEDVAKHAKELQSKPTHLRFPQFQFEIYVHLLLIYL